MYNLEQMSWTWAETKATGILPKESEIKYVRFTQQHEQQGGSSPQKYN